MRQDVKVMQLFVDTLVGTPKFSYPSKQGMKKPADEFAHITLLDEYQIGIPNQVILSESTIDNTITYRTFSPARLKFRVGIVETDGVASSKIMHGWTSEAMKALMISTGYGFIVCNPISIEDTKLEKFWETRQGFSIDLYTTRTFDETVSTIGTINATGKFILEDSCP